jgi:hypothetical protein
MEVRHKKWFCVGFCGAPGLLARCHEGSEGHEGKVKHGFPGLVRG